MAPLTTPAPPLLETVGLTRAFGGLEAVRSVRLTLERGEIRAIIGPNGAGKTTLVSMISGRLVPTAGRVYFNGADITRMPPYARVALGIAYASQTINVYERQSVFDNVALAVQRRLGRGAMAWVSLDRRALRDGVEAALARVGLQDARHRPAGALPYGHRRLLDLAMALALEPRLLILDEPTQGLAPEEIAGLVQLIRTAACGSTILLVEHNMPVVLELAHRITVMDKGAVIAEGPARQIEADPVVQRVYLGEGC
jgi:branched-chain amino acid transport system ATP-binding protein